MTADIAGVLIMGGIFFGLIAAIMLFMTWSHTDDRSRKDLRWRILPTLGIVCLVIILALLWWLVSSAY